MLTLGTQLMSLRGVQSGNKISMSLAEKNAIIFNEWLSKSLKEKLIISKEKSHMIDLLLEETPVMTPIEENSEEDEWTKFSQIIICSEKCLSLAQAVPGTNEQAVAELMAKLFVMLQNKLADDNNALDPILTILNHSLNHFTQPEEKVDVPFSGTRFVHWASHESVKRDFIALARLIFMCIRQMQPSSERKQLKYKMFTLLVESQHRCRTEEQRKDWINELRLEATVRTVRSSGSEAQSNSLFEICHAEKNSSFVHMIDIIVGKTADANTLYSYILHTPLSMQAEILKSALTELNDPLAQRIHSTHAHFAPILLSTCMARFWMIKHSEFAITAYPSMPGIANWNNDEKSVFVCFFDKVRGVRTENSGQSFTMEIDKIKLLADYLSLLPAPFNIKCLADALNSTTDLGHFFKKQALQSGGNNALTAIAVKLKACLVSCNQAFLTQNRQGDETQRILLTAEIENVISNLSAPIPASTSCLSRWISCGFSCVGVRSVSVSVQNTANDPALPLTLTGNQ